MIKSLLKWLQMEWPLLGVLAAFGLTVLFVNPLREVAFIDDWAYALTTRHMMLTGEYRPHDWQAANPLFQTAWGALFISVFGYSFTALRSSTLVLAGFGLVAFYNLSREHRFSPLLAGILTLMLWANPWVIQYSFTYMTDIPFLSLMIGALWLYTRALRQRSLAVMFLASLVAAGVILIRQFGVMFVAALGLIWLLDRERWRGLPFYLVGAGLPLIGAAWQVYASLTSPSWTAQWAAMQQTQLFGQPDLVGELGWRAGVLLQYMAFFCLPLSVAAFLMWLAGLQKDRAGPTARRDVLLVAVPLLMILALNMVGAFLMDKPGTIPLLGWEFSIITDWPPALGGLLTLLVVFGAAALVRLLVLRWMPGSPEDAVTPAARFIDIVTLALFVGHLVFIQLNDRYLLPLLPYTLLVVGKPLEAGLLRWRIPLAGAVTAVLLLGAGIARAVIERDHAVWTGSNLLAERGIPPDQIATVWTWDAYHGGFDKFVAENRAQGRLIRYTFYQTHWYPEQIADATYFVVLLDSPPEDPQWQVVGTVPYQDILFGQHRVYLLEWAPD
jgi:hypothetical protein